LAINGKMTKFGKKQEVMTLYEAILTAADPSQVPGLSRFFKTGPGQYGEGDKFLGIKVPVTREIVGRCWRQLTVRGGQDGQLAPEHFVDWAELERCVTSEYHELRLAGLLALVEIFRHAKKARRGAPVAESAMLQKSCIDFYLAHTAYINNWDLVDLSCYPLLGQWLLDRDRGLLYRLARSGKTIWEQRIGIVSTMTFIRNGQLQDTFRIADILLHHPHDLIHKAVGWLLREAGKRDQAALEEWLRGAPESKAPESTSPESTSPDAKVAGTMAPESQVPRYRQMPRTMLRYAIEKFPEALRQEYLHP